MELYQVGLGMIGLLIVLLIIGVPIAFALAAAGIAGLIGGRSWRSIEFLLGNFTFTHTAHFTYIVIPLFLFMGHMAFSAGLSRSAYDAGTKLLGRSRAGLALATIFGAGAFSTICGSSVATASTMARVAMPEMLRRGYKDSLAAGCVAAGGTLGALIPPSGILVLYSIVTQTSLVQLFRAAFLPGVLTAVVYIIGILIMIRINPSLVPSAPERRFTIREKARAVFGTWELMLLFLIVMGSIYAGFATPTEAAAVGALVALFSVLRRPGRWARVAEGLGTTASASCSIFALLVGAGIFSVALTTTQMPQMLAGLVRDLDLSPTMLLILLMLPYLILGMFLDGVSLMLITVPLVFPLVQEAGIHPVLFGLLVTKAIEIGCLTPPVGLNVLVVKASAPNVSLNAIFKGCIPFVLMEFVVVGLLIGFPIISLVFVP